MIIAEQHPNVTGDAVLGAADNRRRERRVVLGAEEVGVVEREAEEHARREPEEKAWLRPRLELKHRIQLSRRRQPPNQRGQRREERIVKENSVGC